MTTLENGLLVYSVLATLAAVGCWRLYWRELHEWRRVLRETQKCRRDLNRSTRETRRLNAMATELKRRRNLKGFRVD